jgi:uncharacterized protein YebE (UPF0316 family)
MITSYIVFNILNVIIQTIKSIVTIKCNKWVASVVNAVAYGLYTYIVVLTASDLDLWFKIAVTAFANLIGVWVVKYFEEKNRKDKLWKVEATVDYDIDENVKQDLTDNGLVYNYIELGTRWTIFNIFCASQEQSAKAKRILNSYNAKYFVSESKIL